MSTIDLREVDRVEILTLQDNTIDLTQQDNSEVIQRAMPLVGLEVKNSILAEHGFSSLVTVTEGEASRCMLFDFGFSEHGAAFNADALGADLTRVESMALSHGHLDHVGGIHELVKRTGKTDVPLVLHPAAFRNPRFLKISDDFKLIFPAFTREKAESAGAAVVDTEQPYAMLDHAGAFLGQIPRTTAFEKGAPNLYCEIDGQEQQDPFDDDSAIVFNVKGKGLVVLSGCAHAGIVNTVAHAKEVTGVDKVMAVMGGFHLSGMDVDTVIQPTIDALKAVNPTYIVPTHCTGRQAIQMIEKEMPDSFVLNMSGTKLTFSA
ncbi:MBL fold metallo-hydrolase [Desulfosarcina widdelii]|uniref:MBL fold metallo-hydrolase n=1 Tax=Desulfosarcina widdelii TaxID=947919 RepID=A0A5K7Z243_9BACT|nr:MBL fold metallo-hydrolase [Desulfosarcina widdelii]BBO74785.1 MBL fold metallo-hydrolase [Desulfosarcina widdelii]